MCKKQEVEDEIHFLFTCERLEFVHDEFVKKMEFEIDGFKDPFDVEKLKLLVSVAHLHKFAKWLVSMYTRRREILYR